MVWRKSFRILKVLTSWFQISKWSNLVKITRTVDDSFHIRPLLIILINLFLSLQLFRALCRRDQILEDWGDKIVVLSAANSYSYEKRKITFQTYCDTMMNPQKVTTPANGMFYLIQRTHEQRTQNWTLLEHESFSKKLRSALNSAA